MIFAGRNTKAKVIDRTRNERQARRQAKLNEIARAVGFSSWRVLETAVIHGASISFDGIVNSPDKK